MEQFMGFWYLSHMYTQTSPLNAHSDVSSETRRSNFGFSLHLRPYFVYARSEALVSLCICSGSPSPLLLDNATSNSRVCWLICKVVS